MTAPAPQTLRDVRRALTRWVSGVLAMSALLLVLDAHAQTFPVSVTVVVSEASSYPEDLAQPGAALVSLTLLDADPGRPLGLDVRLELEATDQDGRVYRVAEPTALPRLTLQPSVPLVLTGQELRPYLDQLIGEGAQPGALGRERSGLFAEGALEFCARVYAADRLDLPPISAPSSCALA